MRLVLKLKLNLQVQNILKNDLMLIKRLQSLKKI